MHLNIKIDEKLRDGKYQQSISRLSQELEKIVEDTSHGDPSEIEEVRWELAPPSGGDDTLELVLRDRSGEAKFAIPSQRLNDDFHTRMGLLRVWGNLVSNRIRTHRRQSRAERAEGVSA